MLGKILFLKDIKQTVCVRVIHILQDFIDCDDAVFGVILF